MTTSLTFTAPIIVIDEEAPFAEPTRLTAEQISAELTADAEYDAFLAELFSDEAGDVEIGGDYVPFQLSADHYRLDPWEEFDDQPGYRESTAPYLF